MKKKMWKQLTAAAAVAVMVGTACAGTAFAKRTTEWCAAT